jgi:uncharacterized protein (TIGR03435 family)
MSKWLASNRVIRRTSMATRIAAVARKAGSSLAVGVAVAVAVGGLSAAQSPSFEVASIRRNASNDGMIGLQMQPGGRMTFTNAPPRMLITRAYGVQTFQVVGGPDWLTSERYDITAKAPEGSTSPAQLNLMLQSLLADRFKLMLRRETRELPVYFLVKAREDGRLGQGLMPAAVDCSAARGRAAGPPPGPTAPPRAGGPGTLAPPAGDCRAMIAPGRLTVSGQPIGVVANALANQLGRPVIDKTALTGAYDFELTFTPEGRGMPIGPPPPGAPPLPPIDPDAPSLFTALQEQLGLKLDAGRGPVEVLVIDSAERPMED